MSLFAELSKIEGYVEHLTVVQELAAVAKKLLPVIEANPQLIAGLSPQVAEAAQILAIAEPDVKALLAGAAAYKAATVPAVAPVTAPVTGAVAS